MICYKIIVREIYNILLTFEIYFYKDIENMINIQ